MMHGQKNIKLVYIFCYKPMDIFQRTRLQIIPFYISIKYHGEFKRS